MIEEVSGVVVCRGNRRSIAKLVSDCVASECFDILGKQTKNLHRG